MLQKAMAKLAATTRSRRRPLASDGFVGLGSGVARGHQSRPSPRPAMTGNGFERSSTSAPDGSMAWTGTRAHCSSSQPGIWSAVSNAAAAGRDHAELRRLHDQPVRAG